jgi:hypothetical protein
MYLHEDRRRYLRRTTLLGRANLYAREVELVQGSLASGGNIGESGVEVGIITIGIHSLLLEGF